LLTRATPRDAQKRQLVCRIIDFVVVSELSQKVFFCLDGFGGALQTCLMAKGAVCLLDTATSGVKPGVVCKKSELADRNN
jgi:hypothetical protein